MNTFISKDALISLYCHEGLPTDAIAERLEVSPTYVLKALRIHEIAIRRRGNPQGSWVLPLDLEEIRHLYRSERLSIRQIAHKLGVATRSIRLRLIYMGIIRNISDALRISHEINPRIGFRSPRWNGGRYQDKNGYVHIKMPAHPHCDKQGYVPEHRLIMEAILGRYLLPTEVVHHINENTEDNRQDNLQLFKSKGAHSAYHTKNGVGRKSRRINE